MMASHFLSRTLHVERQYHEIYVNSLISRAVLMSETAAVEKANEVVGPASMHQSLFTPVIYNNKSSSGKIRKRETKFD
jgi:hypothetical protein